MDILYLMIICSVLLAVVFLIIFIVSAKNGQFEDDESPAVRILLDSEILSEKKETDPQNELKQQTKVKSD